MTSFEAKVSDFIGHNQLLDKSKRYLVALSGGADSVCLLIVLQRLGYEIEAAHCNFHLRGEEADRDEFFCESLCKAKNIPFHRVHFDTKSYAGLHHVSIEMAARKLRYNYFYQLLQTVGLQGVCVGHHRDDVVETVLMNLIRGTGIHGLTGISPKAPIPVSLDSLNMKEKKPFSVIRPLLSVSKQEIQNYLKSQGECYVTDATNLCADVVRNKIRLNVIPQLEDILPSASANIADTASRLKNAELLFQEALERRISEATCHVANGNNDGTNLENRGFIAGMHAYQLEKLFENEYVLFSVLRNYGFSSAQVEDIYSKGIPQTGQKWNSLTHTVLADREILQVIQNDDPRLGTNISEKKFPIEGVYNLGELGVFCISKTNLDSGQDVLSFVVKSADVACLDADKIDFPLLLRPVKDGDRFRPYGMKGTKLVSDYLTDRKLTAYEKLCQLVVCDETGRILWLVGERIDDSYAVSPATRSILFIKRS